MVGVAQLVEHRIVAPGVVGSIPIVHPIFFKAPDSGLASLFQRFADVVKLVDTLDLGSSAARCESSSLSVRTIFFLWFFIPGLHIARLALSVRSSVVFVIRPMMTSRYQASRMLTL